LAGPEAVPIAVGSLFPKGNTITTPTGRVEGPPIRKPI